MPLPPPPADALISTGYPTASAKARASSTRSTTPSEPGTVGTPQAVMVSRAAALLPMRSMHSGDGPMNTRSFSAQARAKSAFSAKKP